MVYTEVQWEFVRPADIVMQAADSYFTGMTRLDVLARRCRDSDGVREKYRRAVRPELTPAERINIGRAVSLAHQATAKLVRMARLPWRIALLGDQDVDDGFPHTHQDIIVLTLPSLRSSAQDLARTLVHEKIHIFQRAYPAETHVLLLERLKLRALGQVHRIISDGTRIRRNPDVNDWAYGYMSPVDPGLFVYACQEYVVERPQNLSSDTAVRTHAILLPESRPDSAHVPAAFWRALVRYEHPYEAMAYTLADLLVPPPGSRHIPQDEGDVYADTVLAWAREYM